jgi:hypothetical protein
MQISISTLQGISFSFIFISAISILLYSYGSRIISDLRKNDEKDVFSFEAKTKVDSYFTSKGYLVWDIKQEEKTKRWNVSLVKNEKIIEAKGFSLQEIERYAENLI